MQDGELVELRRGQCGRLVAAVGDFEVPVDSRDDAPSLAIARARAQRKVRRPA